MSSFFDKFDAFNLKDFIKPTGKLKFWSFIIKDTKDPDTRLILSNVEQDGNFLKLKFYNSKTGKDVLKKAYIVVEK